MKENTIQLNQSARSLKILNLGAVFGILKCLFWQTINGIGNKMKLVQLCKGKIHRATVTGCDLDYVGSITIDKDLMDAAGLIDGELVHIWNINNGERVETYTIPGERGSGEVCLNGAAARRCSVGDKVIIAAFVLTDEPVTRRVVMVDDQNRITSQF